MAPRSPRASCCTRRCCRIGGHPCDQPTWRGPAVRRRLDHAERLKTLYGQCAKPAAMTSASCCRCRWSARKTIRSAEGAAQRRGQHHPASFGRNLRAMVREQAGPNPAFRARAPATRFVLTGGASQLGGVRELAATHSRTATVRLGRPAVGLRGIAGKSPPARPLRPRPACSIWAAGEGRGLYDIEAGYRARTGGWNCVPATRAVSRKIASDEPVPCTGIEGFPQRGPSRAPWRIRFSVLQITLAQNRPVNSGKNLP